MSTFFDQLKKQIAIPLITLAILLATACTDRKTVYAQHVDFKDGIWNDTDTVTFSFAIPEAQKPYNLALFLRNDNRYSYQNIYYAVELSGGGFKERITYQLYLSDIEGRWKGEGHGGLFLVDVAYKKALRFPSAGTYTVRINHQMRDHQLIGIQNVGIIISDPSVVQ